MRLTTLRSDQRGQTGIALVIIIAWALTAVFMLTKTLVEAQQIDNRVAEIVGETTPIKTDTAFIDRLEETNRIAKGILAAAAPITVQLGEVDNSAKSINQTVPSILANAQSIGSTVGSINGNVNSILATAREIASGPTSLGGVRAINQRIDVALPEVRGIKADTGRIREEVRAGDGIHGHLCRLPTGGDSHC